MRIKPFLLTTKYERRPFQKRRLFMVENSIINKTNYLINESQLERVNSSFSYMCMLNIYPYPKIYKILPTVRGWPKLNMKALITALVSVEKR